MTNKIRRKTNIVCTIGPKTSSYEMLRKMAKTGMNIARFNMSHGTHEWHNEVINNVRKLNKKEGFVVSTMLDTKGPEVRSGDLATEIKIKKGDEFVFTVDYSKKCEGNRTTVNYLEFINDVKIGDILLVDGGMLSFKVIKKTKTDAICECIDGGGLTSRRHLNVQGKSASLPSITKKDWEDLKFGVKQKVDFVSLSFIKNEKTVKEIRKFYKENNTATQIIVKLESADCVPHIENIIKEADGVMVARGDLGSELPVEEVPLLQQQMIDLCRKHNKTVIVATHLLESMIENPTPTRAEVSDIAFAVTQKADAIMLSGETAMGKYPLKAINIMDRVARRIEQSFLKDLKINVNFEDNQAKQIVLSGAYVGNNIKADAILVFTCSGHMASLTSNCRPNPIIYAFASTERVKHKLNLNWGIKPSNIKFSKDPEKTVQLAIKVLKENGNLKKGNTIVVVSNILAGDAEKQNVDTVQIRTIN